MDELSAYRSRIGLFAYTAYKKSIQGKKPKPRQRKLEPVTKQTSKRRTTTEVTMEPERRHCTLALVLLLVSVACSIERYGYMPEISYLTSVDWLTGNGYLSEISYRTSVDWLTGNGYMPEISYLTSVDWLTGNGTLSSGYGCHYPGNCYYRSTVSSKQDFQSVPVIGITGVISLDSFTSDTKQNHLNSLLMYTEILSYNYTVLNYRDITSPVSEEPVCTVNSCDNYTVLNYRHITSPVSGVPVCTVNCCDNYTVLNYMGITSPVSGEPVCTVNSCDNYTVLNYRDITSPVSEEPVCTINSCDNYTVLNYRDITSPVSEEPVCTINSCDNYTVLNYRDITSPVSGEPVRTLNSCDNYTVINYRDITSPVSEEPVCAVNSCDNYTVLNYRNITSTVSEEPVCTVNSCDNYTVLNYRDITSPVSGEPVCTVNSCDNYTVLNYRNITSPVSEEPVCTVNSCDNYTVLNYRDITSLVSGEPFCTINSCDNYTLLNYRNITSPVSEEPFCAVNSCDKYTVLNYRDIISLVSEKPVCTVNSCDNYTVLNYRDITSPMSEEPVCTVNSCDNYTVLNYRNITSPVSGEPVCTVNSCDNYTVLNYRDITSPVSEEPFFTVNSCDNYKVLNYRDITSLVSGEPFCTINSCDNYTLLNYRNITSPVSGEPVCTVNSCDNYTVLNYRDITSPMSEEPVCAVNSCDNYTVLNYRDITSPESEEPVCTITTCDNYTVLNYRNITSPVSGEPVCTINSCDNYTVLNYRNITSPESEEPVCTVNSCDNYTVLNYRNITSLVSGEPFCTVNSCDNYTVLNYRDITSPVSEEPVCTINTCDNYTVLNYRDITSPVSGEPVCTINTCDNYTVLNYRNITSPVSGEPVCTINTCDNYTVLKYRNITSPVSGEPVCAVNSIAGTCSYLLGNSGCHMYNGNPRNRGGEAWLTPETLRLIKKHVDESVGYIKTMTTQGNAWATGFRVGDRQMMTAYHVFRQKIDDLLVELAMELERRLPEENFQELCRRLDVRTEKDNTESFAMAVKRVLRRFLKDKATNTSLLLQQLEGLINTEQFISEFENNWKQNCVVDFTNNRRYAVDWKVEFGDEDNDIIIVKLLAEAGQTFPRAMLLDENYMDHGDIHVIRYIHDDTPKVIMDQDTQEFRDDAELQRSVEAAVQWWRTKFPDEPEIFFSDRYNDCRKSYDEETGHVVLRASKSFTHGASGSPIVYSFNSTGQPIVGMIFQRGHPGFYYRAQVSFSEEDRRFKDLQVDSKAFFEGGTTMKKASQLLDRYRKHELKQNIFSLPRNMEVHAVNLDDLTAMLQTRIAQEFTTLRQDQAQAFTALRADQDQGFTRLRAEQAQERADLRRDVTAATERLTREVGSVRVQQTAMGDGIRAIQEELDVLAQHAAEFENVYSQNTGPASQHKMPPVDMELFVKKWKEEDELCYVTTGITHVVQKISSDEVCFHCVVGVPGSGKSTAIRHAALHLKENLGFNIYVITKPEEFSAYLDKGIKQLFVQDDIIGDYFVDKVKLNSWDNYNDRIKSCLDKNTKFLSSLRVQLYLSEEVKGKTYIFNEQAHVTDLTQFKLNRDTMAAMLHHYLQVRHVQNIEHLISCVEWEEAERFAGCFPLLCRVFCEDESVRVYPWKYFWDPLPVLQNVFQQIKTNNKPQFCGLVLCGITELIDECFSPLCELNKPPHFNSIIESLDLDPKKDLLKIKEALKTLDGVYISHIGNRYTFLHSIFQNIVTYLYDDKYYVFKYATRDFIKSRVRLFAKLATDDQYVLVYGEECVDLLVSRMIHELKSSGNTLEAARFIVYNRYINNETLISRLVTQLYDHHDVSITQDMTDRLFAVSTIAVLISTPSAPHTDMTSCPAYQLLASLITRHDCSRRLLRGWGWRYPILMSVNCGSLPVTKLLLTKPEVSLDVSDDYNNSCVLHRAVKCRNNVDMTKYLLSLPNLKCLNHRDKDGHTPYWWAVNRPDVKHRQELIKLYKDKGAIL